MKERCDDMNKKPLVIRMKEARESIFSHFQTVIREQDLPCCILEPIVADLHRQVSSVAMQEYQQAEKKIAEEGNEEE